jgi:hypothetical protein
MAMVVPVYRCGAVLDFHQVPYSLTEPASTNSNLNIQWNGDGSQQLIVD